VAQTQHRSPTDTGLGVGNLLTTVPENLDPEKMMKRLQDLHGTVVQHSTKVATIGQGEWTPKSHSQTIVNTSRSRKQLLDGVILPNWDGTIN
jgi:hypothetical protein